MAVFLGWPIRRKEARVHRGGSEEGSMEQIQGTWTSSHMVQGNNGSYIPTVPFFFWSITPQLVQEKV